MTFKFNTSSINDTIKDLKQASKQCKGSMRPKGARKRVLFRLYDYDGKYVSTYYGSANGWTKPLVRKMYQIKSGSIESDCQPHPTKKRTRGSVRNR